MYLSRKHTHCLYYTLTKSLNNMPHKPHSYIIHCLRINWLFARLLYEDKKNTNKIEFYIKSVDGREQWLIITVIHVNKFSIFITAEYVNGNSCSIALWLLSVLANQLNVIHFCTKHTIHYWSVFFYLLRQLLLPNGKIIFHRDSNP